MTVGEIFEDAGSALTLYAFIMQGATERLICKDVAAGDYYWWPIKEKRTDNKGKSYDEVVAVKMSFRNREDAERAHKVVSQS